MTGNCCQLGGAGALGVTKAPRSNKKLSNPAIPRTVKSAKAVQTATAARVAHQAAVARAAHQAAAASFSPAEEDEFIRMVTEDAGERASGRGAPREKSRRGDLTWLTLAGDAVMGARDAVSVTDKTLKWCKGWSQRAEAELAKAQGGRGAQREVLRKAILFSGAAYGCAEVVWRAGEAKGGRSGAGFKTLVERRVEERKRVHLKMGRMRRLVD